MWEQVFKPLPRKNTQTMIDTQKKAYHKIHTTFSFYLGADTAIKTIGNCIYFLTQLKEEYEEKSVRDRVARIQTTAVRAQNI